MLNNRYNEEKIKNFYYLLAYAFEEDKISFDTNQKFGNEKFENIYDLFSIILNIKVSNLIKEGLYGQYININDKIDYVKGRINIIDTTKYNTIKTYNKVICNYDEYSSNNILNQIIKTTIHTLLKKDILYSNKIKLKKIYYSLENIDIINNIKIINWNNIKFNKLNDKYTMIIKICEYILNKEIMNNESNIDEFDTFDDNQKYHQLFEKFVRNYIKKYYQEYRKVKTNNIDIKSEKMKWNYDVNKYNINTKYIPLMHTDITLSHKNKYKIIDTKFYSKIFNSKSYNEYEKISINTNNWYQINSYVLNKKYELENIKKIDHAQVSGMLLYAQTNKEKVQDKEIEAYIMGNKMQVKIIDFNKKFGNPYKPEKDTIVYQMQQLAENILNEIK